MSMQRQTSENIFAPNVGYCLYIREDYPRANRVNSRMP